MKISPLQPLQCLYVSYCIIACAFLPASKELVLCVSDDRDNQISPHPNISTSKPPQLGKLGSRTELIKACVCSCGHCVNMMTNKLHFILLVVNQCYSVSKKPNILMIVVDDLGWADVPWHDPTIYAPRFVPLNLPVVLFFRYIFHAG